MKVARNIVLVVVMLGVTQLLVRYTPLNAQIGTPWGSSCSSDRTTCNANAGQDYSDCVAGCDVTHNYTQCVNNCKTYKTSETNACTLAYNSCLSQRQQACVSWCGASCGNQAVNYSAYNDTNFSCTCTCADGTSGGAVACGGAPTPCANGQNAQCQFDGQAFAWFCPTSPTSGGSSGAGGSSTACVGNPPACLGGAATCDYNGSAGLFQWNCPPAPPCVCDGSAPTCPDELLAQCVNSGLNTPCEWACASPILLDVDGSGLEMTNASQGVRFDIFGSGQPVQVAWTNAGSTNAWLALDRNGNGVIDNATELFGTVTPQPASPHPNGFAALAVFDQPDHGGNGDGVIDQRDAVFSKLLLWQDTNHDGISQPNELHSLHELGIAKIELNYTEARRRDEFGNAFHYKAHVWLESGVRGGRIAWDVYPVWSW